MEKKLFQYNKNKPCYYCGEAPPSSQEHVPPKSLFKGYDCDSITVPSCDKHNNNRSERDYKIILALQLYLKVYMENYYPHYALPDYIKLAIENYEKNKKDVGNSVQLKKILSDPFPSLDVALPYLDGSLGLDNWIRQITAGLLWSITGEKTPLIDFENSHVLSPYYLQTGKQLTIFEAAEKIKNLLIDQAYIESYNWSLGWLKSPKKYTSEIYKFYFYINEYNLIFLKHIFYNQLIWYIGFKIPDYISKMVKDFNVRGPHEQTKNHRTQKTL